MANNTITAMTTVIRIRHREETVINGAPKVTYADADPALDCCCWMNSGRGKVAERDGVLTYVDAVDVLMWYRPDISIKDRIVLEDTTQEYEIISPPENIEMRYQHLAFKVQRVGGA